MTSPAFALAQIRPALGKAKLLKLHAEARNYGCAFTDARENWKVADLVSALNEARARYWDDRPMDTMIIETRSKAAPRQSKHKTVPAAPLPCDPCLPAPEINTWLKTLPLREIA